jgi:hypothetical protein
MRMPLDGENIVLAAAKINKEMFCVELKNEYEAFTNSLRKIAALNIVSLIAEDGFSNVTIGGARFRLSNDFSDGYTTILTDEEILELANQGAFNKLIKEQSVIAMCSLFENYVNRLIDLCSLDMREASSYNHIVQDFSLQKGSDNSTLRKIYFIIKKLGFKQLPFEHKQPIDLLGEIFTIRHVVVHFDGIIKKENHEKAICAKHKKDGMIVITDNSIDDFIHRIVIHMSGFTKRIDDYLESCSHESKV